MRQHKLTLPPARPDAVSRLIRSVSGRKLKMSAGTTNATFMVADRDPVHLLDIDENGKEYLVAQFVLSPEQKTPPKFIRTGQKYPDPDPSDEKPESKEPEKADESPAVTSDSPPESAPRVLTPQEILRLKIEKIKAAQAQK